MLTRQRAHVRPLVLLLPIVVALVALSAAAPAAHAEGCQLDGPKRDTPHEGGKVSTRICHAYATGEVRDFRFSRRAGVLDAGDSWFVCQKQLPGVNNPPVAGARNNYWLYTRADRVRSKVSRGWGWFPANLISGGDNFERIPGLRICATGEN